MNEISVPEPVISEDFLQGNVENGLERLRLRLLDLTNRNRLLSFRYTKKSTLRVVDELPDKLFEMLVDGRSLVFRHVPRPSRARLLEAAERGGQRDLLVGEEPGSGQPPRLPTAAEHAATLGVWTSFDLPEPASDSVDARHQDREVQTLHYPEELEAILRSMSSSARLAIEETGTNMLYLAFGFLEWYESEDSRQERYAPLLLLPVSLERGAADPQTQAYRYTIQYSGEDIVANVSLQERMRRDFNIAIPDLEDEENPEHYFDRVQRVARRFGRWQVRRQVTLALLAFGKFLMYRDLDSRNWPAGKGPASHGRIRDLFLGAERGAIGLATEYRIDDPKLQDLVPPIIDDADSSQHSALVDAVAGKNLVIQGPPGTGKSQTITNLIAAALAQDKTVLFVSEKLAALEVVRHRLNRAGLGHFCLELHSHKTQKKALIEDLRARLDLSSRFRSPRILDDKLKSLEHHKKLLTEYVDLVNSSYGKLGQTVYDILWMCRRRRSRLDFDASLVDELSIPDAREIDFAELEERRHLVTAFATHLNAVLQPTGRLLDHPWAGVSNMELTFLDERKLVEFVSKVFEGSRELDREMAELNGLLPHRVEPVGDVACPFARNARALAPVGGGILVNLLPVLRDESVREKLQEFGERLASYRTLHDELVRQVGRIPRIPAGAPERLAPAVSFARGELVGVATVGELRERGNTLARGAATIAAAARGADELARWLGVAAPLTPVTLPGFETALRIVRSGPLDNLHLRHPGLEAESAIPGLVVATRGAEGLRDKREALATRLHLELIPPIHEVRQHATATANARWWSFLDPSYRAAKRSYLAMSKAAGRPSRQQVREDYQQLMVYLSEVEHFGANAGYRQVAGPHFEGIDTPYEKLLELAEWLAGIRRDLVFASEIGRTMGPAIWNAPADRLRGLAETAARHAEVGASLNRALESLGALPGQLAAHRLPRPEASLLEYGSQLADLSGRCGKGFEALSLAGFGDRIALRDVPSLVERTIQHDLLLAELGHDQRVAAVLGEHFDGPETDFARVLDTFRYYAQLTSAPLPPGVLGWLLEADTGIRLEALRSRCGRVLSRYSELEATFGEFVAFAHLGSHWLETTTVLGSIPFGRIRDRAARALDARERLPEWLDYIRALAALTRARMGDLLGPAESGRLRPGSLPVAFDYVFANSLATSIFREHPQLVQFSGLSHEQIRQRFVELDRETIELNRARTAYRIDQRPIPLGVDTGPVRNRTELGLIEREISKQKRHVPIRQLVSRAGRALQALKPCFMMGPLSVAQYLEPGQLHFDLIVMDEASQLRPEDALGAVSRGQQVVVVGDPMQLPPTNFFDRIGDEEEADEDETAQSLTEAESILDVASAVYRPMRMLRWHYRSRHGELIAFSNKEFYRNELVVFPSPLAKTPDLGVKLVHVADGVYQGRRNVIEARRLIDAAFKHMRLHPQESLGIVALNSTQRELLENELEQRLKSDVHAQRYIERHQTGLEPLFVKNLENVQGDERDVIFISITYGPDRNGHVFQRFGPINGETGHRRLNVLFTRARKRVVVFSSMLAEHVQVQPNSKAGVRALKGYLAFAQTGILEQATFTGREPDSDFEVEVAEALRARGFEVVAQLGVAGYFLDLAVKHPRKPDAYIAAIECDGATYHSSLSARDRDRLRQMVLEGLGWNVLRIWSTDWFKNPTSQVERIVARLSEVMAAEPVVEEVATEEYVAFGRPSSGGNGSAPGARLSFSDARRRLMELRDTRIFREHPRADPSTSILRDEMIEALLRHRPVDRSEWMDRVPFELRLDTDGKQMGYLDDILDIVARISD